jgi:ATP-dependent Zn protease
VLERFEAIDGEATLQAAMEEALELVVEHWDAVLRVADALDARKTLSQRQVAELVAEPN